MIHSHIKQKAHDISTKLPLWNYNQSDAFVCFRAGLKVKMVFFFLCANVCVCVGMLSYLPLKMGNFANRANLHTAIFKDLETKANGITRKSNRIYHVYSFLPCNLYEIRLEQTVQNRRHKQKKKKKKKKKIHGWGT